MTPAMATSETNMPSYPNAFVSGALSRLDLLGFGHADTLPEMGCISPLCASHSWSSARRLRAHSVRGRVCLPGGFPPAPRPHFAALPPLHQYGPPHAAGRCTASIFTRRLALTRRGCRKSERTPNHALQRTGVAVTARASAAAFPTAMHGPRQPRPSLSLGSMGGTAPLFCAPFLSPSSAPPPPSYSGCFSQHSTHIGPEPSSA